MVKKNEAIKNSLHNNQTPEVPALRGLVVYQPPSSLSATRLPNPLQTTSSTLTAPHAYNGLNTTPCEFHLSTRSVRSGEGMGARKGRNGAIWVLDCARLASDGIDVGHILFCADAHVRQDASSNFRNSPTMYVTDTVMEWAN